MACIRPRKGKDGKMTYTVNIRMRGQDFCKTFSTKEDAELYEFYKERLIENMHNFEVDIKDRVTLEDLYELKHKAICEKKTEDSKKALSDLKVSYEKCKSALRAHNFVNELSYQDWVDALRVLEKTEIYKGADKPQNRRLPALATLRRFFATCSAVFSNAINMGINVENHPSKVIKMHLKDKIKAEKRQKVA